MDAIVIAKSPASRLHFEPFTLDLHRAELTRAGLSVALRPKTFALLRHLAVHAGRAVTKEELLDAVWPGVVVTDDSLSQCVAELRAALGDGGQRIIKTLPRLGYRFDAPVRVEASSAAAGNAGAVSAPRVQSVEAPSSAALSTAKWTGGLLIVALLLGGLSLGLSKYLSPPLQIDVELALRRSLAVMPLADLSEPKAAYFAEGVTEELITDLTRLNVLLISARGLTAAAVGREGELDVRKVGLALGARHVMTGSVRRDGDSVQVTVHLFRADTGAVLWSDRFDYSGASKWNWGSDISRRIANTLEVKVREAAMAPPLRGRRSDVVDQTMRAEYLQRRLTTRSELLEARALMTAAIAADPSSVNALAGLSFTHTNDVVQRWSADPAADLAVAKNLARQALAIDANHPVALAALSSALMFTSELDEAMRVVDKQLALSPNHSRAHRDKAAVLNMMGHFEGALDHADIALRLNPLDVGHTNKCHSIAGMALFYLNRDEAAYERMKLSVEAMPGVSSPHFQLAAIAAMTGRSAEAAAHLAAGLRLRPNATIAGVRAGYGSKAPTFLAASERLYEGLRRAGMPESPVAPVATASSVAVR